MYRDKGGQTIRINSEGLEWDVHLPPVGKGQFYNLKIVDDDYFEEDKLEEVDVIERSPIAKEQYWERPLPPQKLEAREATEAQLRLRDKGFFDPELEAYRRREWHRRLYGVWFMNYNPRKKKSEPVYLTGLHYLYLTHWKIDVGYPKFRMPDRNVFYALDYVIQDPHSYGLLELTKRRFGKTFRCGVFLFDYPSRNKNIHAGIQSKTGDDAKKNVFAKAVVQPFRKMISTFKPIYDESKGSNPSTSLKFFKTNKRGKVDRDYLDKEELESWIDWESAKKIAYDGKKLHRYGSDECFKCEEVDIWERHEVIKPCLVDDERIIGKAYYTSTVEEMSPSQIESSRKLWNYSDISKRDENGETKSGLYRYFTPAYQTLYIDKYGYPDEEKATQYFLNKRESLRDDPKALASFIRKHPFTWEEAFRTDGDACLFNALKIDERLDVLQWKDIDVMRGNFEWVNGEKSTVEFKERQNGKWLVAWLPDEKDRNRIRRMGSGMFPAIPNMGVIGIDPYDHDQTVDGQGSKGAGSAFRKYDERDEFFSDNFVAMYLARPLKSRIFYDDMAKFCVYYGYSAVIEDNKVGIINYFNDNGYGGYLMRINGKDGVSSSPKMKNNLAEDMEDFIEDNCHRVMFKEMLEEWKVFNIVKTTKYDLSMSTGYALYGANQMKRRATNMAYGKNANVTSYFRKYKTKSLM